MANASIRELWIYPVKSCRGTRLDSAVLGERGIAADREWMIVDARGKFLTQRSLPRLASIVPQLQPTTLRLCRENQPDLLLPRDPAALGGASVRVEIWKDTADAVDAGPEAAAWLEKALGVPARLVRATAATLRQPSEQWRQGLAAPVNFPDAFPLLVCNEGSLAELNTRLPAALPMTRFRPNIVIDGLPAYAEDRISALTTAGIELRLTKPCTRCSVPGVDQNTGVPDVSPLPVLMSYRYDAALAGATFGVNALIAAGVGQTLRPGPVSVRFTPTSAAG